ncbi:hypothetical protein C1645_817706 [Glomus cerebriforme]|uniref:Uncharacterized protein n=1 Tax=Glomus cerebriforme TaxID=658196 RepID=A0A397TI25_9GLOM|nr:hypothetical protein C1645_817706 [Glomus cerebriforme]
MFWVHKVLKPKKNQFGIVGVQVAGNMLHLNVLIRDKANVHRYFYLQSAEIPMRLSDVERQKEDSITVSTPMRDD